MSLLSLTITYFQCLIMEGEMLLRMQDTPPRQGLTLFLPPPIVCWRDSGQLISLSCASVSWSEEVNGIIQPKGALKAVMNKHDDWGNYHHYSGVQKVRSYVRLIPSSSSFLSTHLRGFHNGIQYNFICSTDRKTEALTWEGHMSSRW